MEIRQQGIANFHVPLDTMPWMIHIDVSLIVLLLQQNQDTYYLKTGLTENVSPLALILNHMPIHYPLTDFVMQHVLLAHLQLMLKIEDV